MMKALRNHRRRGASLIEFAFIAFILIVMMLAGIEIDRMVLVYTTLADSARAGVRYAIAHGSNRSGSGLDGSSGPTNTTQVATIVKGYASMGILNPANLTVNVTYTANSVFTAGSPGSTVKVVVQYPYDPFTALPLRVTLSAMSFGVIACCITSS